MNKTTENFLQVMAEFQWPEDKPIFWRCYYDDQGDVITYSMEDLPGNYIDIDAETFCRGPRNVKIINGKMVYLSNNTSQKLKPSIDGITCDPRDVCVIVPSDRPNIRWSLVKIEKN